MNIQKAINHKLIINKLIKILLVSMVLQMCLPIFSFALPEENKSNTASTTSTTTSVASPSTASPSVASPSVASPSVASTSNVSSSTTSTQASETEKTTEVETKKAAEAETEKTAEVETEKAKSSPVLHYVSSSRSSGSSYSSSSRSGSSSSNSSSSGSSSSNSLPAEVVYIADSPTSALSTNATHQSTSATKTPVSTEGTTKSVTSTSRSSTGTQKKTTVTEYVEAVEEDESPEYGSPVEESSIKIAGNEDTFNGVFEIKQEEVEESASINDDVNEDAPNNFMDMFRKFIIVCAVVLLGAGIIAVVIYFIYNSYRHACT